MNLIGLSFDPPIYNASGPLSVTEDELLAIAKSHSGAVLLKSATKNKRNGNEKPRYFQNELGSVNSMGLPNLGPEAYCKLVPELRKFKKPIIASVAGMEKSEYMPIAQQFLDAKVDALEINLSCPNLIGKPQIAFDFDASMKILEEIKNQSGKTPVGVKLPPYPDPIFNSQMAKIVQELKLDFITTLNSVPHACLIDVEKEEFVIKNKYGGLGGDYVKPVALGQVHRFYELLNGKIPIIGCGGIKSGRDIVEFFLAGASGVQIGTQLMKEGPSVFARLEKELIEELKKKKLDLNNMSKLIGRAKPRLNQIVGMLDY